MNISYKPKRVFWVSICCSNGYFMCGTLSSEVVGSSIFFVCTCSTGEPVYWNKRKKKNSNQESYWKELFCFKNHILVH